MHLSRVDLPDPLEPISPNVEPTGMSRIHVVEHPVLLVGATAAPEHRRFHRLVAHQVATEPFGDMVDHDGAAAGVDPAHSSSARRASKRENTQMPRTSRPTAHAAT